MSLNGLVESGLFGSALAPQMAASAVPMALQSPFGTALAAMNSEDFQRLAAMQNAQGQRIPTQQEQFERIEKPQHKVNRKVVESVVIESLPQSHHLLYGGSREEN